MLEAAVTKLWLMPPAFFDVREAAFSISIPFLSCRLMWLACYTFMPTDNGFQPFKWIVCWQNHEAVDSGPGPAIRVLWCFYQSEGDLSQSGISGK